MRVEFKTDTLRRLYLDPSYRPKKYGHEIIRGYRKKVQLLHNATTEQELRNFKSLRLEKLQGARSGTSSIRINDQWRILLRFDTDTDGRLVIVLDIADYH